MHVSVLLYCTLETETLTIALVEVTYTLWIQFGLCDNTDEQLVNVVIESGGGFNKFAAYLFSQFSTSYNLIENNKISKLKLYLYYIIIYIEIR